jgi:hypothetical protein
MTTSYQCCCGPCNSFATVMFIRQIDVVIPQMSFCSCALQLTVFSRALEDIVTILSETQNSQLESQEAHYMSIVLAFIQRFVNALCILSCICAFVLFPD